MAADVLYSRLLQTQGLCGVMLRFDPAPGQDPRSCVHICELSTGHYGLHVCDICKLAFNDAGELFAPQRLPGMDVPFKRSNET